LITSSVRRRCQSNYCLHVHQSARQIDQFANGAGSPATAIKLQIPAGGQLDGSRVGQYPVEIMSAPARQHQQPLVPPSARSRIDLAAVPNKLALNRQQTGSRQTAAAQVK